MKKQLLLGLFFLGTIFTTQAQQQISHNTNPDAASAGGSVACPTPPNVFSRSFVLSGFGITTDWVVSEVEFGLQDYAANNPIVITLSTTSQAYPGGYPGSLTQLATQTVSFTEGGESLFILKQVPMNVTVPAGSELVVEISGDFFMGGNTAGQNAPSFLMATGCGAATPTNVATIDPEFADVAYIINVTGSSTASVNDFLASKLSVFPNPANDMVTISNGENILINGVEIVDVNGRTVKLSKYEGVTEAKINISDLSSGLYLMNVSSDKGSVIKKIVKN